MTKKYNIPFLAQRSAALQVITIVLVVVVVVVVVVLVLVLVVLGGDKVRKINEMTIFE